VPRPTTDAGPKPAEKPAPEAAAKKKGAAETAAAGSGLIARREVVWWCVFGFIFACLAASVKFFFPRAIFEPKTRFRIGYPSDYGFGVSTKWQQAQRIWVVRDSGGLYVIFAKCTHLGCTPDWKETENKFKCPCHGSGFDTEGVNFEGPAPWPLDRLHVEVDAEGQIVVDKSKAYGGRTLADAKAAWQEPGAYLQV
jgi:cytochrome b6-f complex iron-sulfur subunit